jgi:hypothetical protein
MPKLGMDVVFQGESGSRSHIAKLSRMTQSGHRGWSVPEAGGVPFSSLRPVRVPVRMNYFVSRRLVGFGEQQSAYSLYASAAKKFEADGCGGSGTQSPINDSS